MRLIPGGKKGEAAETHQRAEQTGCGGARKVQGKEVRLG